MALNVNSTIRLNDEREMPLIGLGVYKLPKGPPTEKAVGWAIDAGYRHIDTAMFYGNENSVGKAINNHAIAREKMWVTTKLWLSNYHNPKKAIAKSVERLNIDYIDLYLIHWPIPVPAPGFYKRLWRSMESFVEEGLCKSIGVSNFSTGQLQKILSDANIPPAVNQVECSVFKYPKKLHKFCTENEVALEGYSPLSQGNNLDNETLRRAASKYNKTSAQIMLKWALQKNIIVIPKSQVKERIIENIDIYDFSVDEVDMKTLDSLSSDI